jgi:hypothetical protein
MGESLPARGVASKPLPIADRPCVGTICRSRLKRRGLGWQFQAASQGVGLRPRDSGGPSKRSGAFWGFGPAIGRPRAIGTFINRTLLVLKSGEANPVSIAYGSPPTDAGGLSIFISVPNCHDFSKERNRAAKTAPRHI